MIKNEKHVIQLDWNANSTIEELLNLKRESELDDSELDVELGIDVVMIK